MMNIEQQKKNQIEAKRMEQDLRVYETMEEKSRQTMISKEANNLKRQDRVKTVERIMRQNEYHKEQIQEKILRDNAKAQAIKDQKEEILMQRRKMTKEAIVQKTKINEAFEKMKCKGKMDPNIMTKLGITTNTSPARPQTMGA